MIEINDPNLMNYLPIFWKILFVVLIITVISKLISTLIIKISKHKNNTKLSLILSYGLVIFFFLLLTYKTTVINPAVYVFFIVFFYYAFIMFIPFAVIVTILDFLFRRHFYATVVGLIILIGSLGLFLPRSYEWTKTTMKGNIQYNQTYICECFGYKSKGLRASHCFGIPYSCHITKEFEGGIPGIFQ